MSPSKIICVAVLVLGALAAVSHGATITYALPDLLGSYVYDNITSDGWVGTAKFATVGPSLSVWSIRSLHVVLAGFVSPGRIRGDGVIRAATEMDLVGCVDYSIQVGDCSYGHIHGAANDGPFRDEYDYSGPFHAFIDLPSPGSPPEDPSIRVDALLCPVFAMDLPPWLSTPPDEFRWNSISGIEVITPMTATVTEAYIIADVVSEPTVALILGLGAVMFPRRRKGRSR